MDELINYKGVAEDIRLKDKKALDYTHEDVIGGAITNISWEEKISWITLDLRKQITSSSCGGQSGGKILTAFKNIICSATPPYHFRSNYPEEGMWIQDIGNVLKNKKTTNETISPSQNMTETQMNSASIPIELPYGISGYYTLPSNSAINMDLIATALEKGHGIIFGISSNGQEWLDIPVYNNQTPTFSHFVACVPKNYLLHKGEKSVVIDDSCNAFSSIKGTGQRILTETFLKNRCWGILALIPEIPFHKLLHTFNTDLKKGMTNPDVEALQECLINAGFLKNGFNTGFFGTITESAVIKFQEKYSDDILTPQGLQIGTGYVGLATRKKLNELYSQ